MNSHMSEEIQQAYEQAIIVRAVLSSQGFKVPIELVKDAIALSHDYESWRSWEVSDFKPSNALASHVVDELVSMSRARKRGPSREQHVPIEQWRGHDDQNEQLKRRVLKMKNHDDIPLNEINRASGIPWVTLKHFQRTADFKDRPRVRLKGDQCLHGPSMRNSPRRPCHKSTDERDPSET